MRRVMQHWLAPNRCHPTWVVFLCGLIGIKIARTINIFQAETIIIFN
jgi:hypothetical protein